VSGEVGAAPDRTVRPEGDAADVAAGRGHSAQATGRIEPQIPLDSTGRLAVPELRSSRAAVTVQPWTVVGYQDRCALPDPGRDDEQRFWLESLVRSVTGVPQVAWPANRCSRGCSRSAIAAGPG
jgi:hypothetical protein